MAKITSIKKIIKPYVLADIPKNCVESSTLPGLISHQKLKAFAVKKPISPGKILSWYNLTNHMGKSEYGWNQIPIVITVANDIIIALSQELSLCFCMIATIPSTGIKTANDALKRKLKVKNNANRRRLLLSNAKRTSLF